MSNFIPSVISRVYLSFEIKIKKDEKKINDFLTPSFQKKDSIFLIKILASAFFQMVVKSSNPRESLNFCERYDWLKISYYAQSDFQLEKKKFWRRWKVLFCFF